MSVPKKFNETVNFKNRIEALNDLTFYKIKYNFKLTDNYKDELAKVGIREEDINGIKEFSALNKEQAKAKIKNWFTVLKKSNILKSYKIKKTTERSFYDIIKENPSIGVVIPEINKN